jgi:diguanylate cyclase (GGDEF)-like protein
MTADLERALAAGTDARPAVLVMFDLDGFKMYNDRFGHLAGDTLLAHLGGRLQAAVGRSGAAYRPGGDEFCVLLTRDVDTADVTIAAAVAALSAEGEGFAVTTSFGSVSVPAEAHTPNSALRLADDRMYSHKGGRPGSARSQSHNVLVEVLRERQPDLHQHLCEVGRLAVLVGNRLGMDKEELDVLRRAAELHDVGKAAVPDAILNKPGPLAENEWSFMRRHTIVGERILAAAPALVPVATLVRSSHERWDGGGYPDRLAGAAIPQGSRIVAVCDAFDAMISDRPYATPRTPAEAVVELRAGAGTQFDPEVVEAFVAVWDELSVEPPDSGAFDGEPIGEPVAGLPVHALHQVS